MEKAIFAAGCFWGIEASFAELPGVLSTEVGYIGGQTNNPTYEDVTHGHTGHAEAVKVFFDPSQISYELLLNKFFELHNPLEVNQKVSNVGGQYRSAIFFTTPEQAALAKEIIKKLASSPRYYKPIATEVEPAPMFWRAEEYHQKYIEKHRRRDSRT